MFKNFTIFTCLSLLILSCGAEVPQEVNTQINSVISNTQSVDSVIVEEPVKILTGFLRFFFVKDSLGFELENVKILADSYLSEKIYFNQLEKDTAYFIILDFLKEIRIAPEDDKALYEYNEVKESEIAKYYKRFGVLIESTEGEYYCVPDYSYLVQLFDGDLNSDLDIYKDFLVVSSRHIFNDGGIMITWMELASQIIKIEEFYTDLKYTKFANEVFSEYCRVIHPLMYGTENSYIIDDSSDSIVGLIPEAMEVYDLMILDPMHNSGNLFKVHLENLKKAQFGVFAEDLPYMSDNEIKEFLDFN